MTLDGNRFFEPEFKPDFDPELLETTNYIGRFFLVKRDFFEKYGSVDADFSGACDYDLLLRLTEAAERRATRPHSTDSLPYTDGGRGF